MAIFWIIAAAVLAGVSDQTGMILKNIFKRLRPCQIHDGIVNARLLLADCPSSYSFVSNHAINHFSFALFIILTLQFKKQYINAVFIFWAFIIGYSQIYVGVHFPLDVLGGAVAGIILGYFFAFLYRKLITFANSKRVKNM
ncbi:MAG: phosphatase PAP2 family protein [Ferruginibacter sp.]